MHRLLQPRVFIPVVVGAGIIVGMLGIAGPGSVVDAVGRFSTLDLLWSAALLLGFAIVRGVQWYFLLTVQDISVSVRGKIFAFILGEAAKTLPLGNFFQNYLLEQQSANVGKGHLYVFSRTSAATVLIVLLELASGLSVLAIFGLGAWTHTVRAVIVLGVPGTVLVALTTRALFERHGAHYQAQAGWKLSVAQSFRIFGQGAQELLDWRVLVVSFVLAVLYMTLEACVLRIVFAGSGLHDIGFIAALSAYNFSVVFNLIIPFPTDVGVTEAGGAAALVALGIPLHTAITGMVVFRVLNIVFSLAVTALALPFFRDELAFVLRLAQRS